MKGVKVGRSPKVRESKSGNYLSQYTHGYLQYVFSVRYNHLIYQFYAHVSDFRQINDSWLNYSLKKKERWHVLIFLKDMINYLLVGQPRARALWDADRA